MDEASLVVVRELLLRIVKAIPQLQHFPLADVAVGDVHALVCASGNDTSIEMGPALTLLTIGLIAIPHEKRVAIVRISPVVQTLAASAAMDKMGESSKGDGGVRLVAAIQIDVGEVPALTGNAGFGNFVASAIDDLRRNVLFIAGVRNLAIHVCEAGALFPHRASE